MKDSKKYLDLNHVTHSGTEIFTVHQSLEKDLVWVGLSQFRALLTVEEAVQVRDALNLHIQTYTKD